MLYKTMVLELLQQHPQICRQLQSERRILSALEGYARELSTRHEAWKAVLSEAKPDSNDKQIASAALELALKELEQHLVIPEEAAPLTLEAAMEYVRRHSLPV